MAAALNLEIPEANEANKLQQEDGTYDETKHPSLMQKPGILSAENSLTGVAAKRVMKEYAECVKISFSPSPPFTVELIDNSLSKWKIEVYSLDEERELYEDMIEHSIASITVVVPYVWNC